MSRTLHSNNILARRAASGLVALALILSACGGSEGQLSCESLISASCSRRVACTNPPIKQDDCTVQFTKLLSCSAPDSSCPDGKKFNVAAADACAAATQKATCADVLAGNVAACKTVCQ